MSKNNGGPAFPATVENHSQEPIRGLDNDEVGPGRFVVYGGATLRDLMAIHAPQVPADFSRGQRWTDVPYEENGVKKIDGHFLEETGAEHRARWAYAYADAMLAERAKP